MLSKLLSNKLILILLVLSTIALIALNISQLQVLTVKSKDTDYIVDSYSEFQKYCNNNSTSACFVSTKASAKVNSDTITINDKSIKIETSETSSEINNQTNKNDKITIIGVLKDQSVKTFSLADLANLDSNNCFTAQTIEILKLKNKLIIEDKELTEGEKQILIQDCSLDLVNQVTIDDINYQFINTF